MLTAQPDETQIIQIFDRQPDSVVWFHPVFDADGAVVDFAVHYYNKATERLLGAPLSEVMGERLLQTDRFDPASRDHIFEQCRQVWETGELTDSTYHNAALDRWFNVQRSRVLDGVLSISRDRTAEIRADIEARRQARLLQSIIDHMPSGFSYYEAVRDASGKVTDLQLRLCNQKAAEITGFTIEELYAHTARELMTLRNNTDTFERCVEVVETGAPMYLEFFSPTLRRWIGYSVSRYEDGIMATYLDISQTKESAEQVTRVLNASLNGVMALEAVRDESGAVCDFTFFEVNDAFTSILGLSREQVLGKSYLAIFPASKTHGIFDMHVAVLESGVAEQREFYYNGEQYESWYRICVAPMGGDRVVQTFWDVTENHRHRQQLESTVEELRRSNERLTEFTHVASHDLKEPLRKVILYSNMLEDRYAAALPDDARECLDRIHQTGHRMQDLINDLLVFSQVSRRPDQFVDVDLNALVGGVLSDLESAIAARDAVVAIDPLPTLTGDPLQLRQLFQNLLSNALKFHRAGNRPMVTVTCAQLTWHELPAPFAQHAGRARYHALTVRDNGIGFAPAQNARIFQLFQRLHTRSEFEGTGIGLAIVQKVVENHHGFIATESEVGKGAAFMVYLPG